MARQRPTDGYYKAIISAPVWPEICFGQKPVTVPNIVLSWTLAIAPNKTHIGIEKLMTRFIQV